LQIVGVQNELQTRIGIIPQKSPVRKKLNPVDQKKFIVVQQAHAN
jgi:hypothetical protein